MKSLFWTCFLLTVVGGINWGLVGAFDYNLVNYIFKETPFLEKVVYCAVGIAAILLIPLKLKGCKK